MPTITNPQTQTPLSTLLLQPGTAIECLVKQAVVFMPIVEAVELPDPTQNRVLVTYHSYGSQASETIALTLEDFLRPFMQLRLTKAQDYDCVPAGEDVMEIVGRFQSESRYRVERRSVDGCTHLHCPCPHAESQRTVFPTFPVLWQLLGSQEHCKHSVKAALEWNIDLEGFRFIEG